MTFESVWYILVYVANGVQYGRDIWVVIIKDACLCNEHIIVCPSFGHTLTNAQRVLLSNIIYIIFKSQSQIAAITNFFNSLRT